MHRCNTNKILINDKLGFSTWLLKVFSQELKKMQVFDVKSHVRSLNPIFFMQELSKRLQVKATKFPQISVFLIFMWIVWSRVFKTNFLVPTIASFKLIWNHYSTSTEWPIIGTNGLLMAINSFGTYFHYEIWCTMCKIFVNSCHAIISRLFNRFIQLKNFTTFIFWITYFHTLKKIL